MLFWRKLRDVWIILITKRKCLKWTSNWGKMIPINNASKYHRTVAVYTVTVLWCFLVGIFLPHVLREIINWARGNWFWNVDSTTATAMTNQRYDWLNEEIWSSCTCGTLFGAIFGVVCQMTTWNFHFCGSDEWIFKWKPFAPRNRKYIFRLLHTTWPTWNNRKTHYKEKVLFAQLS